MGSRLQKNSEAVRKRIEGHTFEDETGEEYEGSKFGGFSDYFRRKKIKLQNLDVEIRSSSAETPKIFKGIVAHVNGYTQPSLNELHRLIVSHGGGFMQYLDGKTTVTHIIAANLTLKKAVEFKRYRIVKPAWIVDSVKAGKMLPWESYKVIDEGGSQRLLGFNDGKIVSQAPTQSRGYRDQTTGSWYEGLVKGVAGNIDGEDRTNFPASQPVTQNSTGEYLNPKSLGQPTLQMQADENDEPNPSDPESFSLSSSLEDAIAAAETRHLERQDEAAGGHVNIGEEAAEFPEENIEDNPKPELSVTMAPDYRTQYLPLDLLSPTKKGKSLTAEEHNAILLADPHIRKSSTGNPEFLKQYYSESRLHHLSAWKADLKSRIQQMAAEKSSQKQAQRRKPGARRYVMHVDFDSFFCAVSLKSVPEYVDKPAVVAHGSGLGSEIASCNYSARAFGVKNGMWMKKALELCPDIKVLPYDFPAYEEASRSFYKAILDVGGIVQSVSVDEALVDISSLCLPAGSSDGYGVSQGSICREQEKADEIARKLRQRIKDMTGCAVSVGIGGNILLAKVALRKAKPAGQYQIKPEEILDFIGELLVRNLPGVAYSIGGKLEEMGVKFVKDIRSLSKDRLMTVLGPKTGEKIWDYSRGIDRTEVGEQVIRKSVSAEVNWGIRFTNQPEAEEFVQNLCVELQKRLLDQGVKGRQLTMKIMRRAADAPLDPPKHLGHGKCDTFSKSIVLGVATNSADILSREAVSILRSYGFSPGELRGLGVQMTKLEPLKVAPEGRPSGSQKRISFNTPKLIRNETEDLIDDPDSPPKPILATVHPAAVITRANAADGNTRKPLNLTGTQFIIPTQIDSKVLAELPKDIRSKLMAQSKSAPTSRAQSPKVESRPQSPKIHVDDSWIPSQFDLEVFEALPEDVKAEVRASYLSRSTVARAQGVLPQSPRKVRTINTTHKKATTPTKKRTGLLSRGRNNKHDSNSTLTQSNFLINNRNISMSDSSKPRDHNATNNSDDDNHESDAPDPDFLAALPEDVRAEVLAEHRRMCLARRSGLELSTSTDHKSRPAPNAVPDGQRKILLPPRPPKPTFTTQELSTLPELRDTLSAWHREFLEDGPHGDDVAAMERYLRRVVLEEKDMGKAAGVAKWLAFLIEDSEGTPGAEKGIAGWKEALEGIRETIQKAVTERGLGRLDLG
jgi:DNA repair protein REV1